MSKLDNVHLEVADALGELEKLFTPDMKLTFIARHPTDEECHIVVGNDTMSGLAELLTRKANEESR